MPQSRRAHKAAAGLGDKPGGKLVHTDTTNDLEEQSDIDLLAYALGHFQGRTPDAVGKIRTLADDLGLGRPGAYRGFTWKVLSHRFSELGSSHAPAPVKHKHSGDFNWIGPAKDGIPQYLWDSEAYETVEATHERLQRYVAISWTWGRYQLRDHKGKPAWRYTTGTTWKVPKFDDVPTHSFHHHSHDRLTHLKHVLRDIKAFRYFWVDVLCINQGLDKVARAERKQEIAKQAHIFDKATASIAYLWTLDERQNRDLSRALGSFGALLNTSNHLRPKQQVFDGKPAFAPQSLPTRKDWPTSFAKLKNDNWFTSLWALQEVVLFPSALWMTQDGGFCTLNGYPVTTRLFATCVRLLLAVQELRRYHWDQAEVRYMNAYSISPQHFERLKREMSASEHEHQAAVLQSMAEQGSKASGYRPLIVERSAMPHLPSLVRNRRADKALENEVYQWKQWSFGTSGIDISLRATRTAILVAANNREVVDNQSKEYALLAALKISHHEGLLTSDLLKTDGNYFSPHLLNLIMRAEGTRLFDVIHCSFVRPFKCKSDAVLDVSEWDHLDNDVDFLDIEYPYPGKIPRRNSEDTVLTEYVKVTPMTSHLNTSTQYQRKGIHEFASVLLTKEATLTDMSPSSAHRVNHVALHHDLGDSLRFEDIRGWHMHHAAMLHIPKGANIQSITKKGNGTRLNLYTNGDNVRYLIETLSDFKHIWKTQTWLQQTVGTRPQFLCLPLYTYTLPDRINRIRGSPIMKSYVTVQKEVFVGVVLVGKTDLSRRDSMTCWYKIGTYYGPGELKKLDWNGGILVTSPYEEKRKSMVNNDQCDELALLPRVMIDKIDQLELSYDIISIADVLEEDVDHESRSGSIAPTSAVERPIVPE